MFFIQCVRGLLQKVGQIVCRQTFGKIGGVFLFELGNHGCRHRVFARIIFVKRGAVDLRGGDDVLRGNVAVILFGKQIEQGIANGLVGFDYS